jgi:hypothetical protein
VTALELFRDLWAKAIGTPDFDSRQWQQLEILILAAVAPRRSEPICQHRPLVDSCPYCFAWLLDMVRRAEFIFTNRKTHTAALGDPEYYKREPEWLLDAERALGRRP